MKTKHTAWRLEERFHCWAIVDASGQAVTHIDKIGQPDCGSITSQGRSVDELQQIRQLIAAAPELLVVCRAVVFQALQGKVLERDACIAQARVAIRKAEGSAE